MDPLARTSEGTRSPLRRRVETSNGRVNWRASRGRLCDRGWNRALRVHDRRDAIPFLTEGSDLKRPRDVAGQTWPPLRRRVRQSPQRERVKGRDPLCDGG